MSFTNTNKYDTITRNTDKEGTTIKVKPHHAWCKTTWRWLITSWGIRIVPASLGTTLVITDGVHQSTLVLNGGLGEDEPHVQHMVISHESMTNDEVEPLTEKIYRAITDWRGP